MKARQCFQFLLKLPWRGIFWGNVFFLVIAILSQVFPCETIRNVLQDMLYVVFSPVRKYVFEASPSESNLFWNLASAFSIPLYSALLGGLVEILIWLLGKRRRKHL